MASIWKKAIDRVVKMNTLVKTKSIFVTVVLYTTMFSIPVASAKESPFARLDLREYENPLLQIPILLNSQTIVTASGYTQKSKSSIDYWDIRTGSIVHRIVPATDLDESSLTLSPDKKSIAAAEMVRLDSAENMRYPDRIYVYDLFRMKLLSTVILPWQESVTGVIYSTGSRSNLSVTSVLVDQDKPASIRYYFSSFNALTGKMTARVTEKNEININTASTVFSRSGNLLSVINEDDGPLKISIYRNNGHLLTNYHSDNPAIKTNSPITLASKVAFLSDRILFCNGFLYDIKTNVLTSMPNKNVPEAKCVAVVPEHPIYVFFLTKNGLELRNIRRQRVVRKWESIHEADDIYFAVDQSAIGVLHGGIVDFWKFDPSKLPNDEWNR